MSLMPALWRQLPCRGGSYHVCRDPKKLLIAQEWGLLPSAPAPMPVNGPLDDYVLTVTGSERTAKEQHSVLGGGMDSWTAFNSQRTRQDQDLCLEAGTVHVPFEVPISISTVLSSYVDIMMEFKIPCGSASSSLLIWSSVLYFPIFTNMDMSNDYKLSPLCSSQ